MGKEKRPKIPANLQVSKEAKFESPTAHLKFSWSFSVIDSGGPFGWELCQSHEKYFEILKKKGSFEQMSWTELGNQGSHRVEVHKLSKAAQKRLEELKLDDYESLFSFRISNTNRIWCIQHDDLMRILWWDPNHLVCPSQKKHT